MQFSGNWYINVINEIDKLPLPVQPKLLCALNEKESPSIGSDLYIEIATRAMAATHCGLDAMSEADSFLQDMLNNCSHPQCIWGPPCNGFSTHWA